MKDNRIVLDLNKVQYARFYYKNQHGDTTDLLPSGPTVFAMAFDPDAIRLTGNGEEAKESLMTYAHRMKLLDVWTPHVRFQVQANHSLTYTGDKAISLWKEWNRRIFKKKG